MKAAGFAANADPPGTVPTLTSTSTSTSISDFRRRWTLPVPARIPERWKGHPPLPTDLDLGVWGLDEDRWIVLTDLGDILGTDRIDLVLLEEADPKLRYRVVSAGRLLHSAGPDVENEFELRVLREYQDLAPFRRTQNRYVRERYSRGD